MATWWWSVWTQAKDAVLDKAAQAKTAANNFLAAGSLKAQVQGSMFIISVESRGAGKRWEKGRICLW
jgi:hypothetical protein